MNKLSQRFQFFSRIALMAVFTSFCMLSSKSQISVSGGSGLSATYTSLTKAGGLFAALNSAGTQAGNNIVVTITSDVTNEDGVNALNQGDWTTLTISPSGARTLSGTATSATSAAAGLITLHGADNVTINGLATGGNSLTISNTSLGNAATILLRNDAMGNTITNCNLRGSGVWQRGGVVNISATATTGNDNNTISNNDIAAAGSNRPTTGIFSIGSGTAFNNNITISNNNIYDFLRVDSVNIGIRIDTNNAGHTISNNKIYQPNSASIRYTVAYTHAGISIVCPNGGNGFTVSNNKIGYSSSSQTGTWVITSTAALGNRFVGIIANVGNGTTTSIDGNTVANVYVSSNNTAAAGNSSLCGIQAPGAGNISITNNTIGNTTDGATIDYPNAGYASMYCYQRASGGGVVGINTGSTGSVVVSGNTVGSLRGKDSLVTYVSVAYGFYNSAAASSLTLNGNFFGSTVANNIVAGTPSTTTAASVVVGMGVITLPTTYSCYNNTVRNMYSYGTGSSYVRGFATTTSGTTGAYQIYNNTIHNLSSNSSLADATSANVSAQGIQFGAGGGASIYSNTIYNIANTATVATTTNVIAAGIVIASALNTKVFNNRIYGITNSNPGVTVTAPPMAAGIIIRSGTTTDSVYNNMITLGDNSNTVYVGIQGNHGSTPDPTSYVFHNTIHIMGTPTTGALPSFCFHRGGFTTTVRSQVFVIKNNIFNNTRANGGTATGKHYAIGNNLNATGLTTGWTSGFNILNTVSSSTVGYHNGADQSFINFTSALSDNNSQNNASVTFANVSSGDLHINMGTTPNFIESFGDGSVGITTDIDGHTRPGPTGSVNGGMLAPDMGADEFDGTPSFTCIAPTVSNVNASVNPITCYGSSTVLSLATTFTGTGYSYQWQVSSDNISFTNISLATNATYTVTPLNPTTYYRCIVTCGNGPTSVTSNSITITTPNTISGGTYTINSNVVTGGSNFNNFTDAFNVLNCQGISGPVVFNVASGSGPYVEQVSLSAVRGASATNTITINGNGRTLSFNSTDANNRAGIVLDGADYVTIDNLKIDGSAGTYGICVLLTNNADNNTISNCDLKSSLTSITSTNTAGIMLSGSKTSFATGNTGNNNTFIGNTISGGYYGVAFNGVSTSAATYANNNKVQNCIITDFYIYGVYLLYQNGTIVSGCDISRPVRNNSSTAYGILATTGGSGISLFNNKFHNMFDGLAATHTNACYGFYISATGTAANPNIAYNNMVYNVSGNGAVYGLYIGNTYAKFYHNTVVLDGSNATTASTYAVYHTITTAGVEFKNNLIYVTRSGTGTKRALYFSSATTNSAFNNNAYYFAPVGGTDNHLVYYTSSFNYTTLADWKASNGNLFDQNSFSGNPQFVDIINNDFTPNSGTMDNIGTNVGITTDIFANTRSTSTPDVGAIEYTGAGCQDPPTPGTATTSSSIVCSGINFNLDITGYSTGAGQSYQWQESTDNSTWSNLGSSQTVTNLTTNQTTTKYFRAQVTCGTSTVPTTSILVNVSSPLSGVYTVNKNIAASSTNFTSLTNAMAAMACGIGGPVTFNVVAGSGPYTEQFTVPIVSGSSSTNRITINGNNNLLNPAVTNSANRGVITLDGADFVTIKNFNINAAVSTYGIGVVLTNDAQNDSIIGCVVDAGFNTTSSNYAGISGSTKSAATGTGNNASNCVVMGNTVIGGYYGISFVNTTTPLGANNVVLNNNVEDVYLYHIYGLYQTNMLVRGNNIYHSNRTTTSTFYGIYFSTSTEGCWADKNKIYDIYKNDQAATGAFYGLYCSGTPTAAKPHKFTNNLIDNIFNGGGSLYAAYISSGFAEYYHNTIILDQTTATAGTVYAIYKLSADSVKFKNNIVYVTRGGSGTKRAVYISSASTGDGFDYNNYYFNVTGGTNNHLGSMSALATTFTTLTDWKNGNANYDQNSVSMNVSFKDPGNGNFKPITNALNNLGTYVGINYDIVDSARSNTTPDIGAYEFDIVSCAGATITGGTITGTSGSVCTGNAISFDLVGASYGLGIEYQWQSSINGTSGWTNLSSPSVASAYTGIQTVSSYYRCAVTCTISSITSYSNILYLETPALVSGIFTVDKTQPTAGTNFNSFAEVVNYFGCGINGPVTVNVVSGSGPYTEQFTIPAIIGSSSTNTITFNGNGESIDFNSTVSSNRTAITLDGADWVTINNFDIDGTAGTYGYGIIMVNNADNNTISNCIVNVGRNTTSTNFAGIMITGSKTGLSAATSGSYNTISSCTVYGGYYGIAVDGPSTAPLNTNNKIQNCTVVDAYLYPIYCLYQDGMTISSNEIYKTASRTTYSTGYGIIMSTGNLGFTVEKNKIHNLFAGLTSSTSTQYCLYNSSSSSTVTKPNRFINNLVYNIDGSGTTYGVYITNGATTQVYHNTIVLDNSVTTTSATYGLYHTTANTGTITYRNNNVYIAKAGTGIKRLIHFATTTANIVSNNNNFYFGTVAGADNNLGQWGTTNYLTLALWKGANSNAYDQNSSYVDPQFANASSGNYAALASGLNGVGATTLGVTTDIVNNNRTLFFTPGCYEVDNQAPTFANATITNACASSIGASGVSLNGVVITDGTGIATSGGNMPRIYFRKGTSGAWSSAVGSLASGTSTNGTWNFTINYATVGGATSGDVIQYFVVAQDVSAFNNVGSSTSTGFAASNVNTVTAFPTTPSSITVTAVTPTVTISTTTNTVCSGNSVTFNAMGTNNGSSPIYQWKNNGINAGTGTSITFSPNSIANNAQISCELTSNAFCATSTTASSNVYTMTVNPSPVVAPIFNGNNNFVAGGVTYCNFGSQIAYYCTTLGGTWSSSNPSVVSAVKSSTGTSGIITTISNGTATVSYSLATTTGTGCTTTQTVNVTVAKETTPSSINGVNTLCVGNSTTFTSATVGGVWTTNGRVTINPTSGATLGTSGGTTTISYTTTNAQGCKATSTKSLDVVALPAIPTIGYAVGTANPQLGAPSGYFCTGKSFSLTGTPSGGNWTYTGVASVTPSGVVSLSNSPGTGSITYTYFNNSNCSSSRTINGVTTIACKAKGQNLDNTSKIETSKSFKLFPNPAKNILNIQMDNLVGEGQIILTDLMGKQLKTQPLSMGTNKIDVTSLSKGMYLVSIITDHQKSTQKIVIE